MTRQEANKKILEKIARCIEQFPDWRFHQILQNTCCSQVDCDQWYEEPEDTLARMEKNGMKTWTMNGQ